MQQYELATFAGGCFWCMVKPYNEYDGVIKVTSGYTGGHTENPTYEEVCSDTTGHYEAVQIKFNPEIISYNALLDIFWRQIDPTDIYGQFADRGSSYKSAIFYHNDSQKEEALKSREELQNSGRFNEPIATEILKANTFYPAEEYHQDYYQKNPMHYQMYRIGSGRERFLKDTWNNE